MRNSTACPRCQGTIFYFVPRAQIPDHRYSSTDSFRDITLTGTNTHDSISIEAWVCRRCGYTEFYARDLPGLERLAKVGERVAIVDRTSS